MNSRREFLQFSAVFASIFAGGSFPTVSSPKNLVMEDLLKFNSKGQITLLHITDMTWGRISHPLQPGVTGIHPRLDRL